MTKPCGRCATGRPPPQVHESYAPDAARSDARPPAGDATSIAAQVDAASRSRLRPGRTSAVGAGVLAGIVVLAWNAWFTPGHLSQGPEERGAMQRRAPPPVVAKDARAGTPPLDAKASDVQQKTAEIPLPAQPLPALRLHPEVRKAKHMARYKSHHPAARPIGVSKRSGASALRTGTHRTLAQPSRAGGYSPFAPAKLDVDEYASVTISTDARLRDTLRTPPVVQPDRLPATEWMNHMWQRRVTEIPSEFSKY